MKHVDTAATPFDRKIAPRRHQRIVKRIVSVETQPASSGTMGQIIRLIQDDATHIKHRDESRQHLCWLETSNSSRQNYFKAKMLTKWRKHSFSSQDVLVDYILEGWCKAAVVSPRFIVEPPLRRDSAFDKAQRELERLQDGWAGEGSLAPLPQVLSDLAALIRVLPANFRSPDFEVDAGDGTLTLVWDNGQTSLSLVLSGNGNVVGIISPSSEGYKAWTLPIANEARIAEKLEDSHLGTYFNL